MSSKVDTLIKKATFFEKLALYSDRSAFLQAIAQNNPVGLGDTDPNFGYGVDPNPPVDIPPPPAAIPTSPYTMPITNIIDQFPHIPVEQQKALSAIVTVDKLGIPLARLDGKLGPETRRALEAFKSKYGQQLSDEQALQMATLLYNRDQQYQGV